MNTKSQKKHARKGKSTTIANLSSQRNSRYVGRSSLKSNRSVMRSRNLVRQRRIASLDKNYDRLKENTVIPLSPEEFERFTNYAESNNREIKKSKLDDYTKQYGAERLNKTGEDK
jgi:hypothetical protein